MKDIKRKILVLLILARAIELIPWCRSKGIAVHKTTDPRDRDIVKQEIWEILSRMPAIDAWILVRRGILLYPHDFWDSAAVPMKEFNHLIMLAWEIMAPYPLVRKAILAHELAHIYLRHSGKTEEERLKNEDEANERVIEWGMKRELKKAKQFWVEKILIERGYSCPKKKED